MSGIKPSYEVIIIARKPFVGSLVDNIVKWGVGGLNIDECRVAFNGDKWKPQKSGKTSRAYQSEATTTAGGMAEANDLGRFPANIILSYDDECEDEVCGGFPNTKGSVVLEKGSYGFCFGDNRDSKPMGDGYNDAGSAARYFKNIYYTDKDDDVNIRIIENETEVKGMRLYSEGKDYKLYEGNMLDMLQDIESNSIDSIVTDPPYELNFMGKGWDRSGIAFQANTWNKCLQVLKPGGYLLAFGGSRTYHRIACAIEDAGFEIRDTIMWLYGSGFPKSLNIANSLEGRELFGSANKSDYKKLDGVKGVTSLGFNKKNAEDGWRPNNYNGQETTLKANITTDLAKKWEGWGTALKPSFEPIIVARKPFTGSLVDNVIKYGVGGINIDGCRVGNETHSVNINDFSNQHGNKWGNGEPIGKLGEKEVVGRFPANTILTYDNTDFDEVCGGFPETSSNGGTTTMPDLRDVGKKSKESIGIDKLSFGQVSNAERKETEYIAPCDSGSASRYFYCAKASKKDRDDGLYEFEEVVDCDRNPEAYSADTAFNRSANARKNTHPTVKPTELMQYLIRLVTPAGGTVLDPFNGSGSTGKAVMWENRERLKNYKYVGIELTPEYLPISRARIEYAADPNNVIVKEEVDEETEEVTKVSYKEVSLF